MFNVDGTFHAIDGICAHAGGPVGNGELNGCIVTCPWHGWQYDVTTGRHCLTENIAQQSFPVSVENGDVFVELPEAGRQFQQGNDAAVVESVKAASEVYAPVSGEIVEPNTKLEDDPALVNQDPTESGWFFTMKVSNPDELNDLMDEAAYADYVKELG